MYNYSYEIYQTLQSILNYLDSNIYPLLCVISGLILSLITINLIRWFKR